MPAGISTRSRSPDGFVFAVKGSRFITHMKQLRDIEAPLANFIAQGILRVSKELGPILWRASAVPQAVRKLIAPREWPHVAGELSSGEGRDDNYKGQGCYRRSTNSIQFGILPIACCLTGSSVPFGRIA